MAKEGNIKIKMVYWASSEYGQNRHTRNHGDGASFVKILEMGFARISMSFTCPNQYL